MDKEKHVRRKKGNLIKEKVKVVIDPGHGGSDPGAVSVAEKSFTLEIARKIKEAGQIWAPELEIILTRESDVFMSVQDRVKFANSTKAVAFVSVHINSRIKKNAIQKQFEIESYYLNGLSVNSKAATLCRQCHWSLLTLGQCPDLNVQIKDRGIKTAGFYVLKHTKMPATLLEIGFISDEDDVVWLQNETNQKEVALRIVLGVRSFIGESEL
jgi:N-acetylmuramoyl-L-alanine amidase